jgi:hypothetical protein
LNLHHLHFGLDEISAHRSRKMPSPIETAGCSALLTVREPFIEKSTSLASKAPKSRGAANHELEKTRDMPGVMKTLALISDPELLALMPDLVSTERGSVADVLEHLVEIDRRRLYLDQACSSLSCYCIERLGYSEDEASKRVRVARLASRFPHVLDELRAGAIHLAGLFLLAHYLTEENYERLMTRARGKSRSKLEQLIAAEFPKPDVPDRVCALPEQVTSGALTCPGTGAAATPRNPAAAGAASCGKDGRFAGSSVQSGRLEPLSASSFGVQFTASAELAKKIEQARELLSHTLPGGDLSALFERAIDALLERELKRRLGAGKPRKRRPLAAGSRHVPVEIMRLVWDRDDGQCTFTDEQGRRCSARRHLTIEHRQPYALGGPPTADNLCLLCSAHNAHSARKVFGDAHIEAKRAERQSSAARERLQDDPYAKVHGALRTMGFREPEVRRVLGELRQSQVAPELEPLLRAALQLLAPPAPT